MTDTPAPRICRTCKQRPSGRYYNCKSCRFKAAKVPCPQCGKPKSDIATTCHDCKPKVTGSEHPSWKGGNRVIDRDGYARIKCAGHPKANGTGQYVKEHVLVMEEHLGRYLLPGENVHHKNGDRADNRLENLELWSKAQPAGQRVEDKVAWALELLRLYAPETLHPRRRHERRLPHE